MPKLIILNVLVGVFTAGVNTWGTCMLLQDGGICEGTAYEWRRNAFNALVWTTWAMLALFVICIVAPLQMVPATEHSSPKSWRFRCLILACCCCRSRYAHTVPDCCMSHPSASTCPCHLPPNKLRPENTPASITTAMFPASPMTSTAHQRSMPASAVILHNNILPRLLQEATIVGWPRL